MALRKGLLNQHKSVYGNVKTFDGTTLYLPCLLPDKVTKCTSTLREDDSEVKITIIFRRKKRMGDSMQLYNVLFNQIMLVLNHVQFGRRLFDPTEPKIIPQRKLEIWPGYVTAVDEYEDGVMLQVDVNHKILSSMSVFELLVQIHNTSQRTKENFQQMAMNALLGQVVLMRYNNKNYRIDDIAFDSTPESTFSTATGETSYLDYYKNHYQIEIKDHKQPMLISIKERKIDGKEAEPLKFCLVPELAFLTGYTDEMRADNQVGHVTIFFNVNSFT